MDKHMTACSQETCMCASRQSLRAHAVSPISVSCRPVMLNLTWRCVFLYVHVLVCVSVSVSVPRTQAPDAVVTFWRWDWHPAQLEILAAALPTLSHLKFGPLASDHRLSDAMVTAALTLSPPVSLSVPSLDLQTDHSGAAWPWKEMIIHTLQLEKVLKLPSPAAGVDGGCPVIKFEKLDLTSVKQVRRCTHS